MTSSALVRMDFILKKSWPDWFEAQFFATGIGKQVECWGKPDARTPPLLFSGTLDGKCLIESDNERPKTVD